MQISRRAFIVGALSASATKAGATPSLSQVYRHEFEPPQGHWVCGRLARSWKWWRDPAPEYGMLEVRTEGGLRYGVTAGPFLDDDNHADPGAGHVNILAAASNGLQSGATTPAVIGPGPLDLRGGEFVCVVRRKLQIPRGGRVGLWFQTQDDGIGRNVNYFQQRNLICEAPPGGGSVVSDWEVVRIPFSTDARDWICLGTSARRERVYGCSDSVVSALSRWTINMGVIALLAGREPVEGELHFARIEVWIAPPVRTAHRKAG